MSSLLFRRLCSLLGKVKAIYRGAFGLRGQNSKDAFKCRLCLGVVFVLPGKAEGIRRGAAHVLHHLVLHLLQYDVQGLA